MSHSSSGIVLLHDPTSHGRNILRRSSLAGRVAVAAAATVVGAVPRGMSASSVLIMSVLEDSQPEVDDSVFPSPVAVTTFPLRAPPAAGPAIPRLSVTDEVNPPVDSCPISVR